MTLYPSVPPEESLLDHLGLGLEITVVGMGAVFLGLLMTYAVMVLMPRLGRRAAPAHPKESSSRPAQPEVTTEVAHAIALALFMDLRVLEEEAAAEITIKKLTQPFSPWVYSAKQMILADKASLMQRRGRS